MAAAAPGQVAGAPPWAGGYVTLTVMVTEPTSTHPQLPRGQLVLGRLVAVATWQGAAPSRVSEMVTQLPRHLSVCPGAKAVI